MREVAGTNFVQEFARCDPAAVAPSEILCGISQNFSPAGVTSPFEARGDAHGRHFRRSREWSVEQFAGHEFENCAG